MLDNLFGPNKAEIEQFELFRALNEVFNAILEGTLPPKKRDEFLGFARVAKERGKLGFFLRDYQRMVDAGCDLESAYHWAYCDTLEEASETRSQVFG